MRAARPNKRRHAAHRARGRVAAALRTLIRPAPRALAGTLRGARRASTQWGTTTMEEGARRARGDGREAHRPGVGGAVTRRRRSAPGRRPPCGSTSAERLAMLREHLDAIAASEAEVRARARDARRGALRGCARGGARAAPLGRHPPPLAHRLLHLLPLLLLAGAAHPSAPTDEASTAAALRGIRATGERAQGGHGRAAHARGRRRAASPSCRVVGPPPASTYRTFSPRMSKYAYEHAHEYIRVSAYTYIYIYKCRMRFTHCIATAHLLPFGVPMLRRLCILFGVPKLRVPISPPPQLSKSQFLLVGWGG
jgi:hypothetical protein